MGEGCSFRTIHNLSGRVFSGEGFRLFALAFCKTVRTHLAPIHIKFPKTEAELKTLNEQYAKRGFPGACGSMDGVQVLWDACPYRLKSSFTGKEKQPSVGFNCTVDHELRFLYLTEAFAGRYNDKTKVHYDEYVWELRTGTLKDFTYNIKTCTGDDVLETGPYM